MELDGCIYLSSSWKIRDRVRVLADRLRLEGHEVYDFTDPKCRNVPEIPPETFPELFDPALHNYREYLNRIPAWRQAVECNKEAIQRCKAVVLMLPCGNDAHADAYYGLGLGKPLIVCGQSRLHERTPTHMWADAILDTDEDVPGWFDSQRQCCRCSRTPTVRIARVFTPEERAEIDGYHASFRDAEGIPVWHTGHLRTDLMELPPMSYCDACANVFIATHPEYARQIRSGAARAAE